MYINDLHNKNYLFLECIKRIHTIYDIEKPVPSWFIGYIWHGKASKTIQYKYECGQSSWTRLDHSDNTGGFAEEQADYQLNNANETTSAYRTIVHGWFFGDTLTKSGKSVQMMYKSLKSKSLVN